MFCCREIPIYYCVDCPGGIPDGLLMNHGIHTTSQIARRTTSHVGFQERRSSTTLTSTMSVWVCYMCFSAAEKTVVIWSRSRDKTEGFIYFTGVTKSSSRHHLWLLMVLVQNLISAALHWCRHLCLIHMAGSHVAAVCVNGDVFSHQSCWSWSAFMIWLKPETTIRNIVNSMDSSLHVMLANGKSMYHTGTVALQWAQLISCHCLMPLAAGHLLCKNRLGKSQRFAQSVVALQS